MRFHKLVDLYNDPAVNQISGFAEMARTLDPTNLAALYEDLVECAPRRHRRQKTYLRDRTGAPTTSSRPTRGEAVRVEEHLAMALYNEREHAWSLPDGNGLRVVDYQTPLKERRADKGVGKIDILAVADDSRLAVVELKVKPPSRRGDTPLRAFLEGFAYCAILHANRADVADEFEREDVIIRTDCQPNLIVAAPDSYWSGYPPHPEARKGVGAVQDLAAQVAMISGVETRFLSLGAISPQFGDSHGSPRLEGDLRVTTVEH